MQEEEDDGEAVSRQVIEKANVRQISDDHRHASGFSRFLWLNFVGSYSNRCTFPVD